MKEEIIKNIEALEALLTVVSDNDLLDTDDVENFYRNQDRIINGSLIDNAWEALKLKGKLKEVHNNALKMVEDGLPKDKSGYREAVLLLTKKLEL